jgi:hypothetical protein
MARLDRTKLGVLLGTMAIAALPSPEVEAVPVNETEPNDTFPGQSANAGDVISGTVHSNGSTPDPLDLFHYTGLPVGGAYDLAFHPTSTLEGQTPAHLLQVALYTSQTTFSNPKTADRTQTVHLTGTVPVGGQLSFGVTEVNVANFEAYNLSLNVTPQTGVPEPATVVLVAAGLTALAVGAARRRKRD